MAKKDDNSIIFLSMLVVFASLSLLTFLHDPILHSVIAKFNGWDIESYETGLMTGSTSALMTLQQSTNATTLQLWLFYMFPSLFIYIGTLLVILKSQNRLILISGAVALFLNLASLNPSISGSDAANSVNVLVSKGWVESQAYILHYLIFGLLLIIWMLFLYISIENNPNDAKRRIKNIYS